jgi:hypothetical protein
MDLQPLWHFAGCMLSVLLVFSFLAGVLLAWSYFYYYLRC